MERTISDLGRRIWGQLQEAPMLKDFPSKNSWLKTVC